MCVALARAALSCTAGRLAGTPALLRPHCAPLRAGFHHRRLALLGLSEAAAGPRDGSRHTRRGFATPRTLEDFESDSLGVRSSDAGLRSTRRPRRRERRARVRRASRTTPRASAHSRRPRAASPSPARACALAARSKSGSAGGTLWRTALCFPCTRAASAWGRTTTDLRREHRRDQLPSRTVPAESSDRTGMIAPGVASLATDADCVHTCEAGAWLACSACSPLSSNALPALTLDCAPRAPHPSRTNHKAHSIREPYVVRRRKASVAAVVLRIHG